MSWIVAIALLIVALDQATKFAVVALLAFGESRTVIEGFFNLVHWTNTGAAWGILPDRNGMLAIISALTVLLFYLFRHSFGLNRPENRVAVGLMLGGIVGNFIDRVRIGHVIDFLDFHVRGHHWPAFNVADAAICVGVGLYILMSFQRETNSAPVSTP
jgi:signal peptidase II